MQRILCFLFGFGHDEIVDFMGHEAGFDIYALYCRNCKTRFKTWKERLPQMFDSIKDLVGKEKS